MKCIAFTPDTAVEITAGMSKGARGLVRGEAPVRVEPDEPSYVVRLEQPYQTDRTIRASFLRRLP